MNIFKGFGSLVIVFCIVFLACSCKKEQNPPVLTTLAVTNISARTAVSGGNISDEGDAGVVSRGIVWGDETPTLESNTGFVSSGTGTGLFSCNMTGLNPFTDYNVRAFATNKYGTSYGNLQSFKTLAENATVITISPTNVTDNSATVGGNVTNDGGDEITERGIYWSLSENPEISGTKLAIGSGTGLFSITLSDLNGKATYFVKAYAVNSAGTSYGEQMSFTTGMDLNGEIIFNSSLTYGSVTDIDGNVYKTILIGTQIWMAENLKTTKYNDGANIPNVTDNATWGSLTTPAYCWYENNIAYKTLFGAKYNWFVVETGKICPSGWHIPSDGEWTVLTDYLGGENVAGGKIKEVGLTHWDSPNLGATISSGFTSLPGGQRNAEGSFLGICSYDTWWSSTEYNYLKPYYRSDAAINTVVFRGYGGLKTIGTALRCVKD